MSSPELPEYTARNRALWTSLAGRYAVHAERNWRVEADWGVWRVPETELNVLGDPSGLDVVELGCGTAYWSAWLARRGARPVGIDITEAQLETARRLQREHGLDFPLIQAGAESVPLPDESFDLALSEYGASIWSDPYLWVPEAARLIRAGGRLVFLRNSTLLMICTPLSGECATERLERDAFGLHRFDWADDGSTEFHLMHGDWIRLLRSNGFEVEDLVELRAPSERQENHANVTWEWARRWPAEEIWVARKS
jgi:SAM-dependent methyltransferase